PATATAKPHSTASSTWPVEVPARAPVCVVVSGCPFLCAFVVGGLVVAAGAPAKSCEWTSLAVTTRRVDALKRGLQVVNVTHAPVWFCRMAPSEGETTWLPVVSYTKIPCTVVRTMRSPTLSTLRL